jgi:protein involved in polysaccharide export with SLBB domain
MRHFLFACMLIGHTAWSQLGKSGWNDWSSMSGRPGGLMPGFGSGLGSSMDYAGLPEQEGLFEPIIDSNYILGPGDYLNIGLGSKTAFLPVNPEGYIIVENIGPILVGGKTLLEAKKIVPAIVSKSYKGDKMFVNLGRAKKIATSVVGSVVNPGLYLANAHSRLTDVILLAGGFTQNANKEVVITTSRNQVGHYDLNLYYQKSDLSQNPYLSAGDQILAEGIDYSLPTVQIRQNEQIATMQLKPGRSAYELITEFHHFRKIRDWEYLKVFENGALSATIPKGETRTFIPKAGAILELQAYKPFVFVSGAVAKPGPYEFNANFSPLDYIALAGIQATTGNTQSVKVIDPAGKHYYVDSNKDKMSPGDHIIVPESKETRAFNYVSLLVSVASIVSSIALTVLTLENINSQ